jgi:hypothetical protein
LQDKDDVPEVPRVMLGDPRLQLRPEGLDEVVRATTPVKPLMAVTVIVEVAAVPARTFTLVGEAVTVKSRTVYATEVM